jgi:hypothetical protein
MSFGGDIQTVAWSFHSNKSFQHIGCGERHLLGGFGRPAWRVRSDGVHVA